jgi:hypothetical protein
MPDGYINPDEITSAADETEAKIVRQKSKISFCYVDLADAITVARALHELGGVPCDRDQLAGHMRHTLSGAFVNKTSAATQFGLIEVAHGKIKLTQLGHAILDDARSAAAKAEAFLRVELHRRLYDSFRNGQLPSSPGGLEQALVGFGVPEKQKDKARRSFENSAGQAGFFTHGSDRLVKPIIANAWDEIAAPENAAAVLLTPTRRDEVVAIPAAEHPLIKGLLMSLPGVGETWKADDRVKWLDAAARAFDLMYKGDGSPPIMVTCVEPTLLAWTGFVQLLAKSHESSVTPKMLLSTLLDAWVREDE